MGNHFAQPLFLINDKLCTVKCGLFALEVSVIIKGLTDFRILCIKFKRGNELQNVTFLLSIVVSPSLGLKLESTCGRTLSSEALRSLLIG